MKISVSYDFVPKQKSVNASVVMDHFGVDFESGQHVIADQLDLPVSEGDVICLTGSSGSGKSSIMRAIEDQLESTLRIESLDLSSDQTLVDGLSLPVEESMSLLTACGLGEARLMLRRPTELSDGQKYRYRLALGISQKPKWIVADEFSATLDRKLAKIIACNISRLAKRSGTGFLLATTHEDILVDLNPTLHVHCELDGTIHWEQNEGKKKESAFLTSSASVKEPKPTGRIFHGGITGDTTSDSSDSLLSFGTGKFRLAFVFSRLRRCLSGSGTVFSVLPGSGLPST